MSLTLLCFSQCSMCLNAKCANDSRQNAMATEYQKASLFYDARPSALRVHAVIDPNEGCEIKGICITFSTRHCFWT